MMAEEYTVIGIQFVNHKRQFKNIAAPVISRNIELGLKFLKRFFGSDKHFIFTTLYVGFYVAESDIQLSRKQIDACYGLSAFKNNSAASPAEIVVKAERAVRAVNAEIKRIAVFKMQCVRLQLFKTLFIGLKRSY